MSRSPMIVRTVPALRRAVEACAPERPPSRWCRPWERFMTGMCRWCGSPSAARAKSHRFDLRQPDAVRADGGFRFLSAHLEGRRCQTRRREGRPDLESGRQGDVPGRLRHPDRARRSGHRRSRGSLPAAFLRRRRHRGRQAVHPVPAGCRDLRREGFSAIAGRDADGARSRPRRQGDRLPHRARTRRARDVLAQRLPLAGGTADRADAVPRHEGKRQAAARPARMSRPRWPPAAN